MTLNKSFEGSILYKIDFTPKGTTKRETLLVHAKNRLDASNYLCLNHIWGKQHSIEAHSTNLMK